MADESIRKDIDSTIDELAEAISFLDNFYKAIISKRVRHVNDKLRKVKVYEPLSLSPYQRKVKVYESLTLPNEQDKLPILTIPDNYYPTKSTEVKHVINHERYQYIYAKIVEQLKRKIKDNAEYVELNNFEELFASIKRSAITELYEEYFDLDDVDMLLAIYDRILDLSKDITYEYRIRKAFSI